MMNMFTLQLDRPRVFEMRTGKGMNFNVLFMIENEYGPPSALVAPGFLLMGGTLYPPSIKKKTLYFPACYLSKSMAVAVYNALTTSGWKELGEVPALQPREEAITPLLLTNEVMHKVMPALAAQDARPAY